MRTRSDMDILSPTAQRRQVILNVFILSSRPSSLARRVKQATGYGSSNIRSLLSLLREVSSLESVDASLRPKRRLGGSRTANRERGRQKVETAEGIRDPEVPVAARTGSIAKGPPGLLLSEREAEILLMLYRGLTNTEIAAHLGLSPRTVKGYLSVMFAKFDVSNRTELVGYAADLGLFR